MSKLRISLLGTCLALLVSGPVLADRAEDKEAIEALMWRYARALDTANPEAYAAVYTEDGEFKAGNMSMKGRQALYDFVEGLGGSLGVYHMTADVFIEFIDDTNAIHHSYWLTLNRESGDVVDVGVSADQVVKVDGEWLIKVRDVNADQ